MNNQKIVALIRQANLTEHTDALIALAIAYTGTLPETGMSPGRFYHDHIEAEAVDVICEINELQVVNVKRTTDWVKQSYVHRANAAGFPTTDVDPQIATLPENAFVTLASIIDVLTVC